MPNKKQVVIYGGGMAGAILAKQLTGSAAITLVDPNDFFEVPMSAPRSLVLPSFSEDAIIPFDRALPGVRHLRGRLIEFGENGGKVGLSEGGEVVISGTINVLATGSAFTNPLMRADGSTAEERKSFYEQFSAHIADADRILIVGGGPIGVELAGEISENHPQKKLTILERGPRILAGTSEAASKVAMQELQRRGVEILTNQAVQSSDSSPSAVLSKPGQAQTNTGKVIKYDFIIWCTGGRPNTSYMRAHLPHLLNAQGQIRVDKHLMVKGLRNTFALGDITDLDENKMAWHVAKQVKHAAYNIRQLLSGNTDEQSLKEHQAQTGNPMMAVTLGSTKGVLHLPVVGIIKCALFTKVAKSGHMLVPKYRKELGLPKKG